MSEVGTTEAAESELLGEIHIKIGESSIGYDTEFTTTELVFWLEVVKSIVLDKVLETS